ncbi:EI24 domain-containing protein [Sulfitobacter donghicola]|uniref:Membrane protein n=1 Tax=Sulfitobacter donghicola DSW-25 = KCTC 12864 = JCM 14565 TaxID=1300350 RepID=A0A073IFG6_9RHOB|nr:EI24 domain-containing protein [Sulfitobacter donghicola]KEJ89073.1 membrane protein [Sulfitobacter donghicola DSW-25 = KCTC 12864 = JCM 14565]KIN67352.1 Membrane protein [Sulfitobacter donghicola DSW-25 = KCTC 12864 = JCM 14565]
MALSTIFSAFGLALGQLGDPRFRKVLLLGIGLTLALLIGAAAGFVWLIDWLAGESVWLPVLGEVKWLDDLFSWGAGALLLILSIFLMIPVASAITSMFLDDVADAVEAVHYPHLSQKPRTPLWEAFRDTVNFLGVIVAVNILALILYAAFAPIALFIFWAVNGLLLGREYYTLAAMRRVGRKRAKELRRKNFLTIWAAGTLMAMPLSVPILNLLVPILGAATFTHLFQMLPQGRPAPPSFPDHPR